MTLVAVPVGALLAFLLVRTDLPGGRWLEPLMLAPMFMSSIVLAFGFVVAFGPVGDRKLVGQAGARLHALEPVFEDIAGRCWPA